MAKRLKFIPNEEELSFDKDKKDLSYYRNNHNYYDKRVKGVKPYKMANYVLDSYVGKAFDDAFSYWCKLVPDYQYSIILNRIKRYNLHYVDENGIIRKHKRKRYLQTPITFVSDDYRTEIRHKITNESIETFNISLSELRAIFPNESNQSYYHLYELYEKEFFEKVCVQGWSRTFESKNNPEYKRLMAEKRKRYLLQKKKKFNENMNL